MDPYLELYWGDVHHGLITYAADHLQPTLPRDLRARLDERVFFEFEEDRRQGGEPMSQGSVKIIEAGSGNRVVTVIEFLSPSNKVPGEGQDLYLAKQQEVLAASVSLVEIDLTRTGRRVLSVRPERIPLSHRTTYQVCVRRGWKLPQAEIYLVPLQERLPVIRIPLRETDQDVLLDLQVLIDQCYRNGRYDDLNYRDPLAPLLDPEDAAWADQLLRSQGKR